MSGTVRERIALAIGGYVGWTDAAAKAHHDVLAVLNAPETTAGLDAVLVAHQRHKGGCLCGAVGLGQSHPEHVRAVVLAYLTGERPGG